MRFPWSRRVSREDPAARHHRQAVAGDLAALSDPTPAALALLRRHHPALTEAEQALLRAEAAQRRAVDEVAEQERRAGEICAAVARGQATREGAEKALSASKSAALGLDGFADAVADARGRVALETRLAILAAAASVKARRLVVEQRLAPLRKTLDAAAAELAAIDADVLALQTLSGRYLLAGLDCGDAVTWAASPLDAARMQGYARSVSLGTKPIEYRRVGA